MIRFGPFEYVAAFRSRGHMYMNTLTHFRELEKDELRGDCSEGLSHSRHAKGEEITILETGTKFKISDQIRMHDPNSDYYKIFSFYGITRQNINKFDERIKDFGDTALVILDGMQLIDRIIAEAERIKIPYRIESVEYIDREKHNGDMGPFRKYSDLSYQSEFRVAFRMKHKNSLRDFCIGDISDISAMYESDFAINTLNYSIQKRI